MSQSQLEQRISAATAIQKETVEIDSALRQLEEIKPLLARLAEVSRNVKGVYDSITDAIGEIATTARLAHFKPEEIKPWLRHIWSKYQTQKRDEFVIGLPRFVTYSVGWWDHSDEGYNYFKVNRFTDWLAEVPVDIRKELGLRTPEPLTIQGDMLVAKGPVNPETWQRYKPFLKEQVDESSFRIKPRLTYPLAVQLVKDGILPYSPNQFPKQLIEERPVSFEMQPWQEEARILFRKYSNIGIFAPPGSGKTFTTLRILCDVKPDPPHLVIMKERRLVIQWIERIQALTPLVLGRDVVVETFKTALNKRLFEKAWGILVIDESQDLPADTFSRMAYVNCRGRIGLTASPFREDGRTELIFALTGYPYPMPWQEAMRLKGITPPTINVWFTKDFQEKITKTRELLEAQPGLKTFVYCDHIEPGKILSKVLDAPFVFGEGAPEKSLEILRENPTVVVSRVGDRGLSFADIERIIEVDFLYGSRQQALQRTGRLLHSELRTVHHILMTPTEYEKYHKRLMAYEGKGLRLEFPNRRDFQERVRTRTSVSPRIPASGTIKRITRTEPLVTGSTTAPLAGFQIPEALRQRYPGIDRTFSRLANDGERAVVAAILAKPEQIFDIELLSLATGYSSSTLQHDVDLRPHFGKLVKMRLIKQAGRGKYQANL